MTLKAPFPYFGGKSKVAADVWERFGDVQNYVEPFCGSAAVLLARPTDPRIETVNDANCFIANFWRAVATDPEAVADFADWPVNEADLHARHRWLMLSEASAEWRERMKTDPEFYDPKVAGWWVWGASCWIGAGWCDGGRLFARDGGPSNKKPETRSCRGDTAALYQKRPSVDSGRGDAAVSLADKRPRLTGYGGTGVQRKLRDQIPDLAGDSGAAGRGIHASALHRKIPDVGKSSRGDATAIGLDADRRRPQLTNDQGVARRTAILVWFEELAYRLRRVRVVCGDWSRVLTPAVTQGIGTTAVFLDPPYSRDAGRTAGIYSEDDLDVAHLARKWAIENGGNPLLRIALCGYEGEHELPDGWTVHEWHAQGGYANQKKSGPGYENRKRERIWFSPHCLNGQQGRLVA